jgi:RimJ/RimL family protein N-acetyltransferase
MTHTGTTTIETERLILRRFTLADAAAAHKNWLSDPEVAAYMRWDAYTDVAQVEDYLREVLAGYGQPDFYRWAIALRDDNVAIGAIGFHIESEYDSVADAAYALGKAFWGRGIVSEALAAVLKYALLNVGMNRVEAFHAVNNPASGRVMAKAGMRFEGHSREKYKSHYGYEDCDLYGFLRSDIAI